MRPSNGSQLVKWIKNWLMIKFLTLLIKNSIRLTDWDGLTQVFVFMEVKFLPLSSDQRDLNVSSSEDHLPQSPSPLLLFQSPQLLTRKQRVVCCGKEAKYCKLNMHSILLKWRYKKSINVQSSKLYFYFDSLKNDNFELIFIYLIIFQLCELAWA